MRLKKTEQFNIFRFVGIVLLLITILTGMSCGLRIGEKISLQSIKGFSVGCLNGLDEKVNLYLKGRLTVTQISEVSYCTKTALVIFKDRFLGKKKREFTPDELRKFIHDFLLQDKIINDTFLTQLIRLKRVIIGGPEDKLTISDIKRFIIFIDLLKKEAIFFQPYIRALNISDHERKPGDEKRLNMIEQDLKKSIKRVSVFIKNFSQPYFLTDMKILIREIGFFLNPQYNISGLDQKIALFGSLKQFIVGGLDSIIQPKEWEDFLVGCSYVISAAVSYLLLKKQEVFISPEGMQYVAVMLDDLLKLLSLSVKNHVGNRIDESDFLELTSHLKLAKVIPEKIREKSIRNLFLILFGKVFNVHKGRYGTIELTFDQLKKIRKVIQPWIERQSFLDYISNKGSFQKNIRDPKKISSFFSSKEVFLNWQNFINKMFLLKPLYKKGTRIYLSENLYKGDESKLDYKNLTIYNFYYFISTMMKQGYEKNYPKSPGMNQSELSDFFIDFNPFGEDMDWFEETEGSALAAGEAEFVAANMLVPTAKGFNHDWKQEEYLTHNEVVEYLAYAFSVGFSLKEMETTFLKMCGEDNVSKTEIKDSQYDIDCLKVHLIPVLKKQMNNMPDLQKVLDGMDKKKQIQLAEALIHISFETEQEYQAATYLKRSNLKNIIMGLYFVETTINRYDLNGDLVLQADEIWLGFPTFKGYLSRVLVHLICLESDDLAAAIYAYVIEKKTLPVSNELAWSDLAIARIQLEMHDLWRRWNFDYWDLYLDREKLTRVFSTIIKGFLDKKRERGSEKCPDLKVVIDKRKTMFYK